MGEKKRERESHSKKKGVTEMEKKENEREGDIYKEKIFRNEER